MEPSNPAPTFHVVTIYHEHHSPEQRRDVRKFNTMGAAISLAETIFRQGYLVIRAQTERDRYTFIPVSRILVIEVY